MSIVLDNQIHWIGILWIINGDCNSHWKTKTVFYGTSDKFNANIHIEVEKYAYVFFLSLCLVVILLLNTLSVFLFFSPHILPVGD